MTRLGVSESVMYFPDTNATAHIEKEPEVEGHYTFEGLCGQQLSYCKPEQEVKEANRHLPQKMCKRCVKRQALEQSPVQARG